MVSKELKIGDIVWYPFHSDSYPLHRYYHTKVKIVKIKKEISKNSVHVAYIASVKNPRYECKEAYLGRNELYYTRKESVASEKSIRKEELNFYLKNINDDIKKSKKNITIINNAIKALNRK